MYFLAIQFVFVLKMIKMCDWDAKWDASIKVCLIISRGDRFWDEVEFEKLQTC